jgi:2,3-bisphosphoglycerate-independent phosphoglycerate mutase
MKQPAMADAFQRAKDNGGRLHLMGLVSDGGVHSHQKHLYEILEQAKNAGIEKTFIHAFCDGRDTSPKSAAGYIKDLVSEIKRLDYGSISTLVGRYYAMDRDKRWERVQLAYDALVDGKGQDCVGRDLIEVIEERYAAGETDEFLRPIITDREGMIRVSASYLMNRTLTPSSVSIIDLIECGKSPKPSVSHRYLSRGADNYLILESLQ